MSDEPPIGSVMPCLWSTLRTTSAGEAPSGRHEGAKGNRVDLSQVPSDHGPLCLFNYYSW